MFCHCQILRRNVKLSELATYLRGRKLIVKEANFCSTEEFLAVVKVHTSVAGVVWIEVRLCSIALSERLASLLLHVH